MQVRLAGQVLLLLLPLICSKYTPPSALRRSITALSSHIFSTLQGSEAHQLSEAVASSERELGEAQAAVAAAQQKKAEMVAAAKVGARRAAG